MGRTRGENLDIKVTLARQRIGTSGTTGKCLKPGIQEEGFRLDFNCWSKPANGYLPGKFELPEALKKNTEHSGINEPEPGPPPAPQVRLRLFVGLPSSSATVAHSYPHCGPESFASRSGTGGDGNRGQVGGPPAALQRGSWACATRQKQGGGGGRQQTHPHPQTAPGGSDHFGFSK